MSDDPFDLERFVTAQERGGGYARALTELRDGAKRGHWIWWVFPQLAGLGRSETSRYYGIASLEEARAYLAHPVLGPRLREVTAVVSSHAPATARAIFGGDDVKFRFSMTLFVRAAPDEEPFRNAIDMFFDGAADPLTDDLLAAK
ncbi:MAG: DUF1810 domain-containing protein [Acidimicrobiales bacterium]